MERPIFIACGETFITLTQAEALAFAQVLDYGADRFPELAKMRDFLTELALAEVVPEDQEED